MSSFFHTYFSCCFRSDPEDKPPSPPSERDHLIPVLIDPTPSNLNGSTDQLSPRAKDEQQKAQARFDSIVRTTQSKMVNVSAQLPFNLHGHKARNGSTERSLSLNGHRDRNGVEGYGYGATAHRVQSRSPGPSVRSEARYYDSEDGAARRLPLDARLVTDSEAAAERSGSESASRKSSMRGRTKVRRGQNGVGESSALVNQVTTVRSFLSPGLLN
jgi:hypothetical protein